MGSIGTVLTVMTVTGVIVVLVRAAVVRSRQGRLDDYRETLPLLHLMVFESGHPADPSSAEPDRDPLLKAVRRRAAAIISRWDERDIRDVALFIGAVWLKGAVPFEDLVEFLEQEQDAVRGDPDLVGLHIWRLGRRFGPSPESG